MLFPTKEQKHQLQKAFEACRWVYNKCVEALNANKKTAIKALRERFVNKAAWGRICSEVDVEWADIPYEVRDGALCDAIKAKTSTEAHLDNEAAVAGKPESTKKWVSSSGRRRRSSSRYSCGSATSTTATRGSRASLVRRVIAR